MDLKTTTVDGKIVDIISEQEYVNKWKMYAENPSLCASSAVEIQGDDGETYVLPIRGKSDDRPGIYPEGCIYFTKFPDQESAPGYRADQLDIVDFSNIKTVEEFLNKNSQIREMETSVLTDIDSVFVPQIGQNDSPEMKAFKEAITSKHMDINKYAPRFGDNFLNDKRILKTSSITMNKLVSMCKKLDIEAELTLRNASPDVANPMQKEITVILTGGVDDQ